MSSTTTRLEELQQYKQVRQDTLRLIRNLTQAQSEFSPSRGTWSVGEILDHLVKSQRLYQAQFVKLATLSRSGARPVLYLDQGDIDFAIPFVPKAMMPLLSAPLAIMNAFIPSSVREALIRNQVLPAKNPTASQPNRKIPIEELRKSLTESMESLEGFFDENSDMPFDTMRVCHPAMGNNNIPALLRITAAHEQRHQDQLTALMKDSCFPKA